MDFLISNYEIEEGLLEAAFLTCNVTPEKIIFRDSSWSGRVVATASPYAGFKPRAEAEHIYLVVGDPLLPLDGGFDNDHARPDSDRRTAQVASAWDRIFTGLPDSLTPWHPSLLVRICRAAGGIEIVTDPGAFITLYYHESSAGILLATSPDLIAALVRPAIDEIAMAERLASGQISYPYTFYEGIRQMPPGAHISVNRTGIVSRKWWRAPVQAKDSYASTEAIAAEIRRHGESFLSRIREHVGARGYMTLSAGTDTRYFADLVAKDRKMQVACVCSTAVENNESWAARQVAKAVGLKFILHPRPIDQHAACVLPAPLLIGTQSNWEHAHFHLKGLGMLSDAHFVFGGYAADTFLADGDTYNTARKKALSSGKLDAETATWATNIAALHLAPAVQAEILRRRKSKLELLEITSEVSGQLTNIWPFSQQLTRGHFDALRRNYPAYEFFMTTPIVELGFKMSESDKANSGKAALLRPQNPALLKVPINPDSDPEVRKATQAFRKHYPRQFWPESLLFPGPWTEKRGLLSNRLDEIVAIARQSVAHRLSLEGVSSELNGMHCYAAYTAIQIAEGGRVAA